MEVTLLEIKYFKTTMFNLKNSQIEEVKTCID
jgi:hypothetical protein